MKNDYKVLLGFVGIFLLFSFVLVSVSSFESRVKYDNLVAFTPDISNFDVSFLNQSDMTEEDIRVLVEEKRNVLKSFFQDAKYYTLSEVSFYDSSYDEDYIVFDEDFLNTFKSYVTLDFYGFYWDQMLEVTPKSDVRLKSRIYMAPKTIFDDFYFNSAIASLDVNEEHLILDLASNDSILATINIKLCEEENTFICSRDEYYHFSLKYENDDWKIDLLV